MWKIQLWTCIPTHHQFGFFDALTSLGVNLRVCYFQQVDEARRKLGWGNHPVLPAGQSFVPQSADSLEYVPDWRERIHVIPGIACSFLRKLVRKLSSSGVPWVHWSERSRSGLRAWITYPFKRWYARMINNHALGAFGIGTQAMEQFRGWGVRRERLAMLPYSVPACDGAAPLDPSCEAFCSGRKAFLFLGSLYPVKGVDVALRAFARLAKENSDWVLLLVGDDRTGGYYQRLAHKLGIGDKVLFRGAVDWSHVPRILKCADVLVLPSRGKDGWAVVLNEAASLGLALIASDQVGGAYHLIEPAESGFRVSAGSVNSLATAMGAYVRDPALATFHGQRARRIFENFTPQRNAERFLAALLSWSAMPAPVPNKGRDEGPSISLPRVPLPLRPTAASLPGGE